MLFEKRKVSPMFFVSVLFLYFPLYYAQYSPNPMLVLIATFLFAFVYVSLLYTSHKLYSLLGWSYMLVYIAILSFLANMQFSLFLFNLSNLIVWHYKDQRWNYRTISYVCLLSAVLIWTILGPFGFELRAFLFIIHAFGIALLISNHIELKREEMNKQLQERNASINLLLAENERNRISQDLHDTLGHVFAMMSIKAELVSTLLEKQQIEQAQKEIADLQALAKDSMQEVRQIVQSLKQHTVDEELSILQQMFEMAGVQFTVSGSEMARLLPLAIQDKLAMVLRELANNLLKHSEASKCRLNFEINQKELLLLYEDNGVGFGTITGSELHTIKDRLVTIKGSLEFLSLAEPTRLAIQIPLEEELT